VLHDAPQVTDMGWLDPVGVQLWPRRWTFRRWWVWHLPRSRDVRHSVARRSRARPLQCGWPGGRRRRGGPAAPRGRPGTAVHAPVLAPLGGES